MGGAGCGITALAGADHEREHGEQQRDQTTHQLPRVVDRVDRQYGVVHNRIRRTDGSVAVSGVVRLETLLTTAVGWLAGRNIKAPRSGSNRNAGQDGSAERPIKLGRPREGVGVNPG